MFSRRQLLGLALGAATGCNRPTDGAATAPGKLIALHGAGATFPFPLYSKWIAEYNRLNPAVRINYQSIGSGGGIRQIVAGTVDFGASDAPMKGGEARGAAGPLWHIPSTIGSVALTYNLPRLTQPLKLSSETISGIFLGKIKRWNDPALVADNANASLPAQDIAVIVRTDGSGTTAVFSEYLATVSPGFQENVGVGKSVRWPVGLGAKGNEGVTGQIKITPGSIGYIELAYATQNKLPSAQVKNRSGHFVGPSIAGATAAADGVPMPDALHVSLADSASDSAYPIVAYTYLLLYEDNKDLVKGEALARFVWWAIHDGQKYGADLDYAPLPDRVVAKIESRLKGLRSGPKMLLDGV